VKADISLEKSAIYALLGRIFISELDRQGLHALKDRAISSVLEKLETGFQEYMDSSEWDSERVEELAAEYCQLFIVPGRSALSLRAGQWMGGEDGHAIERLEVIIRGLEFDGSAGVPGYKKVPDDHLGILLYFLSSVYASSEVNIRRLGPSIAGVVLHPWIFRFGEGLLVRTRSPLYAASGKLLLELQYLEREEMEKTGPIGM